MISIGDLVKHVHRKTQGVVIAIKKPNSPLACDIMSPAMNSFWVYYVLLNSGDIEGPLFQGEILQI
jgi:hypothetical protein